MPPTYFPLRWESTGDQWWFASPIDWAAANGHYDLVRELLRLDGNHLIKLTSLRRIRRLETVWDDEEQFDDVANHRSNVARKLFLECETKRGKNSLLRAGYGGWLLYTAASAGDSDFVKELLLRDPLLVFGEGEFGVTDILYAAARSKSFEVFKVIFDFAMSPRFLAGGGKELVENVGEIPSGYKWEMMNRGVHAAARGGNLTILKDLLSNCDSNILSYTDNQGSTILHAAAGRGQVEVVKDLIASFDIINSSDKHGNTALHVAAYRGQLAVVEVLIIQYPSSIYSRNDAGETFLHTAITGFQTPSFRRLDRQIQLMKQLVYMKAFKVDQVINTGDKKGRTALHLAIIGNIHSDLVELLTTVRFIDVNIRDINGMTPLDLLKQRPQSSSSDILTRQLISAGGIFTRQDYSTRKIIASHLRKQSTGASPGTSFRISDARIFLYTGIDYPQDVSGTDDSAEMTQPVSTTETRSPRKSRRLGSVNYAAEQLKRLIHWPKMKQRKMDRRMKKKVDAKEAPVMSLRERYSFKPWTPPNNKRTLAVRSNLPSPNAKKKKTFGSGLVQARRSRSSSFSASSCNSWDRHLETEITRPSCSSSNQTYDVEEMTNTVDGVGSVNKKVMNHYLCFGASAAQPSKAVNGDQKK